MVFVKRTDEWKQAGGTFLLWNSFYCYLNNGVNRVYR